MTQKSKSWKAPKEERDSDDGKYSRFIEHPKAKKSKKACRKFKWDEDDDFWEYR